MYDVLVHCIQLQRVPNSIAIFLLGKNDNTKIRPSLFCRLSIAFSSSSDRDGDARRRTQMLDLSFGALFFNMGSKPIVHIGILTSP